jgi:hypothetical protein
MHGFPLLSMGKYTYDFFEEEKIKHNILTKTGHVEWQTFRLWL